MRIALLIVLSCFSCGALSAQDAAPHIVMLIAEREYQTDESLTAFAKQHFSKKYTYTIVRADPEDRNSLPSIGLISDADLLLVSVRRRTLPKVQLDFVRQYVAQGKPVVGIRTANHAFCLRNQAAPEGYEDWTSWDQDVFGGNYTNHYGNQLKTSVTFNSNPATKSLLQGMAREPFVAGGSLYKVAPLAERTVVCMEGKVEGQPAEPVAWTFRRADGGKSFYTSLGHVDDFAGEPLPTLLLNAIRWGLEKEQ